MSADVKVAAINKLQREAMEWRAVFALVDDLKDYATLESAIDGAKSRLADLKQEAADVETSIANGRTELGRIQGWIQESARELETDRAHAADVIRTAKAEAVEIEEKARVNSEAMKRLAQETVNGLQATAEGLQDQLVDLTQMRDELGEEHRQLLQEHTMLLEKHKKTLETLKGLGLE